MNSETIAVKKTMSCVDPLSFYNAQCSYMYSIIIYFLSVK